MAEETPYFNSITSKRAVEGFYEDEQRSLEGGYLVSIETEDSTEAGIWTYIQEQFPQFLRHLRALAPRDQEKLLAYYTLRKTQTQMAVVFRTTQTACSFQLRASVRCMAALISWGGRTPTPDEMEPLLAKVGYGKIDGHPLAEVISEYAACQSFVEVARNRHIHRPLIRRTISRASKEMIQEHHPPEVQACGWWLFKLIDKSNPFGKGLKKRARAKETDVEVTLPDLVGQNRVSTSDPYLDCLFQSKANF